MRISDWSSDVCSSDLVKTGREFGGHETVKHTAGEYVRGLVHTNTVEGVFSVFKRGMKGIYQHCGDAHLFRYLAEFDFRYNRRTALDVTDTERSEERGGGKGLASPGRTRVSLVHATQ